jgi:hypothetical protein
MDLPLISIITPVGPRHVDHVGVAAASVAWQSVPAAWVEHLIEHDTDRSGPAATRNRALARAKGAFVVFLDADDYLIPTALETYLRGFARAGQASYVYADNYVINADGTHHYSNSAEYDQTHQAHYNQHVVTALVPTALVRAVGGFDDAIDLWEDWTLWLRLAITGYCGQRIREPALVYRISEGERMVRGQALGQPPMELVQRRYANEKGQIVMCGCGQPPEARLAQQQAQFAVQVLGAPAGDIGNGLIRLVYAGLQSGGFFATSQTTGQRYKLGGGRLVDADPADVDWLISIGCQPVVRADFVPPPEPVALGNVAESAAPPMPPAQPLGAAPDDDTPRITELTPGPEAPTEGAPYTPTRLKKRGAA